MPVRGKHAFTLIELLVVISILSLLSSIVLASLNSTRATARNSVRISNVRQIDEAIKQYYWDHGVYPPQDNPNNLSSGYNTQCDSSFLSELVTNKYLSFIPPDPLPCASTHWLWYLNKAGESTGMSLDPLSQENFMMLDCPNPDDAKAVLMIRLENKATNLLPLSVYSQLVNAICYY